jgi:pentalenene oxygenase
MIDGMAKFPMMKAVISEVERYYLPAPVIQKITTTNIDIVGTTIAEGQSVLHIHGLAHYDPTLYPDPFTFNPGRWLDEAPEKPRAFGGGKHLCLGMGVARLLSPLSLGILIRDFQVEPISAPRSVTLAPTIETSPTTTSFPVRVKLK